MFSECSSLTTKSIRISQTTYNKIINTLKGSNSLNDYIGKSESAFDVVTSL